MINTSWSKFIFKDYSIIKNKTVLLRLDLNLPVNEGKVSDISRLSAIIPFVKKLCNSGAKVVVISHFGENGESIKPIADIFINHLPFAKFIPCTNFDEIKNELINIKSGEVVLLENVRMFPGETDNLLSLARNFADLGDVFINDAFSVSHREHASVVGITKYLLSYFGPTVEKELSHLSKILTPPLPALFILGGAKISTKLDLIRKYLDQGVKVFVGGALAHNVLKQLNYEIGESLFDKNAALPEAILNNSNLKIPKDVVLIDGSAVDIKSIPKDGNIVDCGKETIEEIGNLIKEANTIIMNGPLGLYEKGFIHGTEATLSFMAKKPREATYIGGGDTVSAAASIDALKDIGYVSLGGGAMLEYLASGTLVGIDAVTNQ